MRLTAPQAFNTAQFLLVLSAHPLCANAVQGVCDVARDVPENHPSDFGNQL